MTFNRQGWKFSFSFTVPQWLMRLLGLDRPWPGADVFGFARRRYGNRCASIDVEQRIEP